MTRITEFRYCRAHHIPIVDEIVDVPAEEDASTTVTEPEVVVPEKKPVCGRHIIDGLEFDLSGLTGSVRVRHDLLLNSWLDFSYCAEIATGGYARYWTEVIGIVTGSFKLIDSNII